MSRSIYVNGNWVAEEEARVSVFDRAFLMADAVYEVCPVIAGRILEIPAHCARLERSLTELEMRAPVALDDIPALFAEARDRNGLEEGVIYLQISRGAGERSFDIDPEMTPGMVIFTQVKALTDNKGVREGLAIASMPDIRWSRRDIKTVQLLAPSLMKTRAARAGADDVWLVEEGHVTEGASNNAFIVTRDGVLVTRQLSSDILHGVTRLSVLRVAREMQLQVEERPFTIAEAQAAAEAFVTSAGLLATGVTSIDGQMIGEGRPGPVTRRLREVYLQEALDSAS